MHTKADDQVYKNIFFKLFLTFFFKLDHHIVVQEVLELTEFQELLAARVAVFSDLMQILE